MRRTRSRLVHLFHRIKMERDDFLLSVLDSRQAIFIHTTVSSARLGELVATAKCILSPSILVVDAQHFTRVLSEETSNCADMGPVDQTPSLINVNSVPFSGLRL